MGRRAVLAVMLGTAVAAAAATMWFRASLYHPLGNEATDLEIHQGSSARGVLETLHDTGLLPSPTAGRIYLAVRARERSFRFGHYSIPARSRPVDTIDMILDGRVKTLSVTIPEGSMATTVAELMVDAGLGTVEDWNDLIDRAEWIQDLAPEATTLEGFLFPDTYRFAVGLSPESAARHLVEQFREVWEAETRETDPPWGTPFEIVTLASLVEAETPVAEERSRIAGVFRNRLRRGMLLQCDPTVIYALMRRGEWRGRLLRKDWLLDDPYNTYRYPGLPPGPINSPGRSSLAATLAPEAHNYLYFVASPGGGHTFSETLAEHNRAVTALRSSGR